MSEDLERLRDMVGALLAKSLPTRDLIREEIKRVRPVCETVTDDEAEQLAIEFEHVHGVTMSMGYALEDPGFEKWLEDAKSDIDFYYWDRYRRLLGDQDFSGHVLATLDRVTDRALGLLENPQKEGRWDRRGMVVGHVQSGKTANYIGLIAKAADAGYQVIIVIAGIHNNLRGQTQARIDEGFVGFDSSKIFQTKDNNPRIVGVGNYDSSQQPSSFTNTIKDFNKATATAIGIPLDNLQGRPVVFVIKKNMSILRNLIEWLTDHNKKRNASSISAPMLLIDDEADHASINIKRDWDEVSRINGQIRELLGIFDRSCYVGYTATPFANIFVDPDTNDEMFGEDLFPRDFIISLDPPDNYVGSSRVFLSDPDGNEGTSIVRHIEDHADLLPLGHKIDHVVAELPTSLKDAIRTYILARAIRLVWEQERTHNSMLVNVSRFVNVQSQVRNEIHDLLNSISRSVRVNGLKQENEALKDKEIGELKRVFDKEYADIGVLWTEVQKHLLDSVSPIKVIEVNSRASEPIDYQAYSGSGLNVIAVGGFSLSRGLTLEGLTVSYFLRNSMMYDTLMQMGRWFGYRPGYESLCRIWMPEEAEGWYTHIAESIEELRDELRQMAARDATPEEFGLKVRSHPDNLIVTARNKMGSGQKITVSIGLANRFIETATLHWNETDTEINRRTAVEFASNLRNADLALELGEDKPRGKLVRDVPASCVLEFLGGFQNHPASLYTETDPVRRYIEDRMDSELSHWDVLFAGVKHRTDKSLVDNSLGFEIICQRRSSGGRSEKDNVLYVTEKQRVASRGVEAAGLSIDEQEEAESWYRKEEGLDEGNSAKLNYPDRVYRKFRKKPLLIIHMLAIGKENDDLSQHKPVVAWSMSFPRTDREETKVEYVVNTTWFRERYQEEADEEDAEGDND